MDKFVVVSTSVDSKEVADRLAGEIVKRRLAACVHRSKVQSLYRWKGRLESAKEFVLQAKTAADHAGKLMDFIKSNHPYEVPEIVVTPILKGHRPYLDWIAAETRSKAAE